MELGGASERLTASDIITALFCAAIVTWHSVLVFSNMVREKAVQQGRALGLGRAHELTQRLKLLLNALVVQRMMISE